jgi:hypothetical protein
VSISGDGPVLCSATMPTDYTETVLYERRRRLQERPNQGEPPDSLEDVANNYVSCP